MNHSTMQRFRDRVVEVISWCVSIAYLFAVNGVYSGRGSVRDEVLEWTYDIARGKV